MLGKNEYTVGMVSGMIENNEVMHSSRRPQRQMHKAQTPFGMGIYTHSEVIWQAEAYQTPYLSLVCESQLNVPNHFGLGIKG